MIIKVFIDLKNSCNLNVLNIILNLLKFLFWTFKFICHFDNDKPQTCHSHRVHRLDSKVKFFRYFKDRQCHKSYRKSLQEI